MTKHVNQVAAAITRQWLAGNRHPAKMMIVSLDHREFYCAVALTVYIDLCKLGDDHAAAHDFANFMGVPPVDPS